MNVDGLAIRRIQKEKGLTGKKLAEMAGITAQGLSDLKRRETCAGITARAIAYALGVDVKEIQPKQSL